jgi:hypothetical protein
MSTSPTRSSAPPAGPILAAFALSLALAGCGSASLTPTPGPTASGAPSASPTAAASPLPSVTESALPVETGSALPTQTPARTFSQPASLYLRMWYINPSIGPENYFGTSVVISNGKLYYMPEILPASPVPMYHAPMVASITPAGTAIILAAARQDGLLGAAHDFECLHSADAGMIAGTGTTYVTIVTDGVSHALSGVCMYGGEEPTPTPAGLQPGTYDAYVDFVAHMRNLSGWLGADLGPAAEWTPTSLAVTAAVAGESDWWSPTVEPGDTAKWLIGTFAAFGKASDPADLRCAVFSGSDLARQLPSIKQATEGTVFIDSAGAERVLAVRVLMPDEPPPSTCS